ncbi:MULTISPECIES: rod shape-determining protein MreD [Commensalibacter]|uniref:Rod shape-determining protein MreD n=2 Tax=Commensalibacter TaxID=1079922 RepID=W7DLX1_9PROT|nr:MULTISPECIES: hypothetical protein [Commensalibacter]EUK18307.1 hypothetical protein COMX_01115 [Commensalibacter papalotli (ex Servin-Garciduenas et al. 2014)]CAI3935945.1 unnamed protein product [Commensalibacter papalotli (ex Botero et al. 2024)]CAI3939738.1 unnamed protein product [Commensalibacter papalotli (ex Botero et al. 2024)]
MNKKDNTYNFNDQKSPGIRPSLSKFQCIDMAIRSFVPMGFTIFVVLFLSIPFDIPGKNELLPAVVVASVYFWSIYRPKSMPAVGVFCIGFLIDLLNFSPPGVVIFILLITYGIGVTQRFRLAKYNFLLIWLIFAFIAIGMFMLQWVLTSLFSLKLMPYTSFLFEIIFAIGCYPLLSVLFTWAHRTIANPAKV